MLAKRKMPLHVKVLSALVLGAICGAIAQAKWGGTDALKAWQDNLFSPLGAIFLNMIFMVVVPLLFAALVLGVAELGDARKFGRIGMRSLFLTIILSGIAVLLGVGLVNLVKPGNIDRGNHMDRIAVAGAPTGGTLSISKGDALVAEVPVDSAAEAVQTALKQSGLDVICTGGPLPKKPILVEFQNTPVELGKSILSVSSSLEGDPTAKVSTTGTFKLMSAFGNEDDAAKKTEQAGKAQTVAQTIVDLVPKNPLDSAVKALDGGLLAFMVFALFFGVALSTIEAEKAHPVKQFLEGLFAISQKIIDYAMRFAPIGVFGFAFVAASKLGVDAFLALGKYAVIVIVGLAIQLFVIYPIFIFLVAKRNPIEFFRQVRTVMLTAFATSSSNATLPYALKAAEEEVGLPRNISSFVLTVGATANQNGTALFEGITIIFLAQFYGVPLDLTGQFTVMLLSIVAGIGTAGVPGGSWPMIAIILTKIGVPPGSIGLCLGIDRILDMSRTVLNVTGDITIATCVSAMEDRSNALETTAA
ncbi:MAG: dicarboxylate/amino acid:cation symporter [Fimbriimonadaceae bacterium]